MTNPTAPEWPAEIYRLKVSDPVQGGDDGIANVATRQLDTRTQMLREGQQAQGAQITQLQTDLTNLTQVVAGSQAEVLAGVVRAQMSGAGVYSEQFAADWTLIDTGAGTAPLALTEAVVPVAGDDSLDVTSTATLIVGETYVLFNGAGYRQEVTVAQILGPNRIRVTPALTGAVTFPAWLGRTDWDVSTPRQATAPVGGIYRTRPLDLGAPAAQPKAIIIRHSGAGLLDVEWQDADGGDFIDAPWWRRRTVDGQTETQYLIPTSGPTRLRITALGVVTVHWIATQPTPAMAEGAYNPAPRPRLISPTQGDQALGPQPVLQIAAYAPPPGLTVAGVVYEVVKVSDNSVIHTSAPQPVNAAYTLPDGVVLQATAYRFTAKIKASDGSLGDPSKPVVGQTIPDFRVILPPTILTPAAGDADPIGPITLTPFTVQRGVDTCTAVQIQVVEGGDWETAWDRVVPPGTAVFLHEASVRMGRSYAIRARYQGQDLGWSRWSATRQIVIPDEIWITTPGETAWPVPASGQYEIIVIGGGASGYSSESAAEAQGWGVDGWGRPGTGGASGLVERAVRSLTAGQVLQIRVGRGGQPVPTVAVTNDVNGAGAIEYWASCQCGESTQVDDLIALGGGNGWPYNVLSADGLQSYINGVLMVAPMDDRAGPSRGGSQGTSGGGITGGPGHVDGGGMWGAAYYGVYNYFSRYNLRIPTPAQSGPPRPATGAITPLYGGPGAAGVDPPTGSVQLAEKPGANGGEGGKGYGGGGGGAPRPGPGEPSAPGGRGAQGVAIIRLIQEAA